VTRQAGLRYEFGSAADTVKYGLHHARLHYSRGPTCCFIISSPMFRCWREITQGSRCPEKDQCPSWAHAPLPTSLPIDRNMWQNPRLASVSRTAWMQSRQDGLEFLCCGDSCGAPIEDAESRSSGPLRVFLVELPAPSPTGSSIMPQKKN
jgi:hypothetical protein